MSVSKERFREGLTWNEWMDRLADDCFPWEERYRAASLGRLRADYQDVPTPRYVLCLFDPGAAESLAITPVLAKACDQAGEAGGVDFRLFPVDEARDIADQYRADGALDLPLCVVFDDDWIQVGVWRHHHVEPDGDVQATLDSFLHSLVGESEFPWRSGREAARKRWMQAERAREQG
jgi:hypothetical protein